MYASYEVEEPTAELKSAEEWLLDEFFREYREALDNFEFGKAAEFIWTQIKEADLYVANTKPFSLYKTEPEEARKHVAYLVSALWRITVALEPFMPDTAEKIRVAIKNKALTENLFPRKD
jgi:methionyl-tRNA synthetase